MSHDLSKVAARERLKPQREPYWHRLRLGCFVGYRPSKRGALGTWSARAYDDEKRGYKFAALGDYGKLSGADRFRAAKKDAEAFAEKVESGGVVEKKIETVGDACRVYAEDRAEASGRFMRYVYDDPIAKVKLNKLRKRQLKEWRARLASTPALVSRTKTGEPRFRVRAPATINRDMAVLRAALAKVIAHGTPRTEAAWQEALKAIPNADQQRTLYLDREERRRLIEESCEEAVSFIRALCLLPLRPGAMAALTVADFDCRTAELRVGKDKTGRPRRIQVSAAAASLFSNEAKNKLPSAPLLMRQNGKCWDKNSWRIPISAAANRAGIPSGATAYTLRHSTITDLVTAGLPLLTIAQISGTSVEMIERHYGHLTSDAAVRALNELAL